MRLEHFQKLKPHCLACDRSETGQASALQIADILQSDDEHIIEAVLQCSNSACLAEYPVIDGIPFLFRNLKSYLAQHAAMILQRYDLSSVTQSLLGDCCGSDAAFNVTRQQISSYAWAHYADLLPKQFPKVPDVASTLAVQRSFEDLCETHPHGPVLDVGCSVGRTTFELADRTAQLMLGIDINPAMLRLAATALRTGRIDFPLRRNGLVYEIASATLDYARADRVDFWACDAADLPFPTETFKGQQCLNTLDSVSSPGALLLSLGSRLAAGGHLNLACPYDWSSGVTVEDQWIGGHSQRADHGGDPVDVLRRLLQQVPDYRELFTVVAEQDDVGWEVRLHDRSEMHYRLHALVLERRSSAEGE